MRIPNARFAVADDGLVSTVWCKHDFQRRISNFDGVYGVFVCFKDYGAKKAY